MPVIPDATVIDGFFRAEAGLANDRPLDMEDRLVEIEPSRNANFEKILRRIGGRVPKTRMNFNFRKRNLTPNFCKITAVSNAAATTITVDRFDRIHRDALLLNTRTNELYLNNEDAGVAPDDTVNVRSYSHTTPGTNAIRYATAVDDTVVIMNESHAEGEDFPEAWTTESEEITDFIMQMTRRGADLSDIAMAEATYDPRKLRALHNKIAMIEMFRGINLLMYLSQATRETLSAGGARRHAMGGLREKITSNRMSLAGVGSGLTTQVLGEILRLTMYQGAAGQKFAMAGQFAINAASAWPEGSVRVSPLAKEWGYDIKEVITPHGTLNLVYDPVLTDEYGLADKMAIVDGSQARQVFLQTLGRLQVVKKVSSLSTAFRVVDGVKTTAGLQLKNEELSSWVEGIS